MKITGKTSVYGIFGFPVKHSLSPLMQTAAFQHCGIDAVYVPFEVSPEALKDGIKGIKALNVKGINVTVPHKEKVCELVDYLSEDAEFLGATNTVKNENGVLTGYNTDAEGFLRSLLEEGTNVEGKKVVMFGAGGAARAVGYALLKGGAKVLHLINRNFQRAKEVGELLSKRGNVLVYPLKENTAESLVEDADIVVNTTSVGMKEGDPKLFDYSVIKGETVVVDIIYNPPLTPLLKAAKEKGCKVVNGLGMLVHQGAIAFEIWTGKKAPVDVMRKVLEEALYG
ncbi:shikimate dehydrogenase [Desulfurobacterium pacificum]|uniref:Shikimate dehydrogenase (NADP(+)) n=1 Tax=Desulfurobacterium pacificum TaxID=240166 RepID=A0ABY1NIA3_9BACT|nr:shikimate dehydrogenase [Desulfurobacterium pacificum]SMP10381.1 shikimate dehydrogenase [Desulfurobacterium pacificum]